MRPVNINDAPHLNEKVKALYEMSFPKEERLPWWIMRLNARRKDIDICAWLDGQELCGFTSAVRAGGMYLLLFFAIVPEKQGQGYGSGILSVLQQKYETIALNVELWDPEAENFPQRKRRFAFYKRNGFYDTGYHVWEIGGKFRILATGQQLDVPAYKAAFRKLSFGVWDVKVEKA